MSIHSSFRNSNSSSKHRNVLTRLERLEKLTAAERWNSEEQGLFGLPKVRSIKVAMKKKKKAVAEEEATAAAPAAAAK
ncbi:MAG: small basic protein [Planctomycetota bacterium]|nr:small basic protein [Planctomycetota bacterium]